MSVDAARAALVGVWQLVEYRDWRSDAEPRFYPYGSDPLGVFHYDPEGFLSVHVCPGSDAPAESEYLGYFGRYMTGMRTSSHLTDRDVESNVSEEGQS